MPTLLIETSIWAAPQRCFDLARRHCALVDHKVKDAQAIIHWINQHLSIRWVLLDTKALGIQESMAINLLKPILNIDHNPDSIPELSRLRDICRQMARA